MAWSKEEIELLRKIYPNIKNSEIVEYFPGHKIKNIILKASLLKIKKSRNYHVEGDLSVLLEENPIAYYWVGFIMADGTLSKKCRLRFTLAEKDGEQVCKFAEFIKCDNTATYNKEKGKYPFRSVSVQDKYYGEKIRQKFDIKYNKTYDPPVLNFNKWDENLFAAFLIGFIDGDGSIRRQTYRQDCLIRFKNHSSWLNTLQIFSDIICKRVGIKSNKVIINKSGYASFAFTNLKICRYLKNMVKKLELPVLKRKWDLIDENRISGYEIADERKIKILNLIDAGFKIKDIAISTGVSYGCIYAAIKRMKK